jgi:hypothetical protein
LPPAVGGPLEAAAKGAYVDGMRVAMVASAVVVLATAVMVRRFYPDRLVHEAADRPHAAAPEATIAPAPEPDAAPEPSKTSAA